MQRLRWCCGGLWCKGCAALQEAIDQLVESEENLQSGLNDLAGQKHDASEKLRRKRGECERMEQRLLQLKHVRAPYQDELDGLEEELSALYGAYLTKFRSLEYLEAALAKIRGCARNTDLFSIIKMWRHAHWARGS